MDKSDFNEIIAAAVVAKEAGFTRVEIDPDHMIEIGRKFEGMLERIEQAAEFLSFVPVHLAAASEVDDKQYQQSEIAHALHGVTMAIGWLNKEQADKEIADCQGDRSMKDPLELVPGSQGFAYVIDEGSSKLAWFTDSWSFECNCAADSSGDFWEGLETIAPIAQQSLAESKEADLAS